MIRDNNPGAAPDKQPPLPHGWSTEMEGSVVTRGDIELTLRDADTLRVATTPNDDEGGLCCMVDVPFSCIEALTGRHLAGAPPVAEGAPLRVLVDRDILEWAAEMPCEIEADDEEDYDTVTCSKHHSGRCWPCEARVLLRDDAALAAAPLQAEPPAYDDERSKAIRFDLDRAGIESREREAVELVELRAEASRLREALARLRAEGEPPKVRDESGVATSTSRQISGCDDWGIGAAESYSRIEAAHACAMLDEDKLWIRSANLEFHYRYAIAENPRTGERFVIGKFTDDTQWATVLRWLGRNEYTIGEPAATGDLPGSETR